MSAELINTYESVSLSSLTLSDPDKYGFCKVTDIPATLDKSKFLVNGRLPNKVNPSNEWNLIRASGYAYYINSDLYLKINEADAQLSFALSADSFDLTISDVSKIQIFKRYSSEDIKVTDTSGNLILSVGGDSDSKFYFVDESVSVSNFGIGSILVTSDTSGMLK